MQSKGRRGGGGGGGAGGNCISNQSVFTCNKETDQSVKYCMVLLLPVCVNNKLF